MGMSPEMMSDGLRRRGIAVRRRFNDPVLKQADEEHYRQVAAELGITVTDARPSQDAVTPRVGLILL